MKFSTKVRFGMRIMAQVAAEGVSKPVFAWQIAKTQDISEAYVDQILMPLRNSGLLNSRRGRTGGYLLGRPADKITLLDVVEVLDGPIDLVACVGDPSACKRSATCATHRLWTNLAETMRRHLRGISLAELRDQQIELRAVAQA